MTETKRTLRLAVLVSGGGTNLQALIDRCREGTLAADIVVVASDREDAYGLVRARDAGIPAHVVDYGAWLNRRQSVPVASSLPVDLADIDRRQRILKDTDETRRRDRLARLILAEQELIRILDAYRPDYVCLAGFMRLVTPYLLEHFNRGGKWRVLNIHPALLPSFPGQHGYEDTLQYGSKWGGATVHFVDEGEDTGPILAQAVFPIWPTDTIDAVRSRGLRLEYELYAQCVTWLAADQVKLVPAAEGRRPVTLITDPTYYDVLERWTRMAFERA